MNRLLAALVALVLFSLPLYAAPIPPIAALGGAGLVLCAAGLAALRRGLVTAAACAFLAEYAAALWITGAPVSIGAALAFGLALLFLLQIADLARRMRSASIGAGVARSLIARGAGVSLAALATAMLVSSLAGAAAASIHFAAAPFAAAAAALGAVLGAAIAVRSAARGGAARPGAEDPPP
jgi:hypothetical protein